MEMQAALRLAEDAGFEVVAPMDPSKLNFMSEVRDMCAADKCRQYNKRWTCPPGCGTLDEMSELCLSYSDGVIFQTICRMEDEYDFETMGEVFKKLQESTKKLLEMIIESGEDMLPFGNDGCYNCEECTYPDDPCRFPEKAFPSLEACGLMVADVCMQNDVPYYYGKNTIAFTGGFLFNRKV